jgi:hypothetical protein
MKTINSLSGGKTSSYMSVHYPADYNIFALVRIEDKNCSPKDKSLINYVSDKIGMEFIATAEDDATLIAMRDLEQKIGKEIIWLSGKSFDYIVDKKGGRLPSALRRYCTTEMKIRPIFEWWQKNIGEIVKMGIGYRYDEMERKDRFSTTFKGIVGKRGTLNKWENIEWREGWFPLIDEKISYPKIIDWANNSGIIFPKDSNCVGCFHKRDMQLRKNWDDNPQKLKWFSDQEKKSKGTWKSGISYDIIKELSIQKEFIFGGGSGCQAGFCTD